MIFRPFDLTGKTALITSHTGDTCVIDGGYAVF
jgi:hypothetical protein